MAQISVLEVKCHYKEQSALTLSLLGNVPAIKELCQCVSIRHLEFDGQTCAFKKPNLVRTYIKNGSTFGHVHSVAVLQQAKVILPGSC